MHRLRWLPLTFNSGGDKVTIECKGIRTFATYVFILLMTQGCMNYYFASNLNSITTGASKQQIASLFRSQCSAGGWQCTAGFVIRAAQLQADGSLVEVGTVPLTHSPYGEDPVEYWFLFRAGRLVQWGQPDDWQQVSARYDINFNPAPAVRRE